MEALLVRLLVRHIAWGVEVEGMVGEGRKGVILLPRGEMLLCRTM